MGANLTKLSTADDVKGEVERLGPSYVKYGIIAVNEGIGGDMLAGMTESDFAIRFLKDMDVAQLSELQETYGDLGGHCMPNGTRVRTPYAGPPPLYWSSPEPYAAWVSKVGAEAADEKVQKIMQKIEQDTEAEEY